MYNSSTAPSTVASYGWNLLDVSSKSAADALPSGTQGLVWVGDYNNTTCSFAQSDATVSTLALSMVNDAKVFGYLISDEPNPYACPNAPSQHLARTNMLHSIDIQKKVVATLDSNGFSGNFTQDALDQLPLWVGKTDVVGLDPYPCLIGSPCDYTWIDRTIAAANGTSLNYWGVAQAFIEGNWRYPTATELTTMLNQWGASRETGYMTFAWTYLGNNLIDHPDLLTVFQNFNAR